MLSFGKIPARSVDSFGIVGLLGEKCKIYYESIFTSRHIGRVSDLLTARLKNLGTDEIRFRVVMMFSLYEAYQCQLQALGKSDGGALPEPLVIECGFDDEKIAIGVSFTYPESEPFDGTDLVKRIEERRLKTRIEKFIAQMFADSDQVVVRIQAEKRSIEVVSLLGLAGKIDAAELARRRPVEVVALGVDSKVSALKADYVELGDLDYGKLLKEDAPGRLDKPATGEILAKVAENFEVSSNSRIVGSEALQEDILRVSSAAQNMGPDKEQMRIGSKKRPQPGVAVNAEDIESDEAEDVEVAEGEEVAEVELSAAKKQLSLYRTRISRLQSKIEAIESKRQNERIVVRGRPEPSHAQVQEEAKKQISSFARMIKSFFTKNDPEAEIQDTGLAMEEQGGAECQDSSTDEDGSKTEMDPVTGQILRDQVEKLEETISRMQKEAQQLKSDAGGSKTQKWADGMVGELLAEKARVHEMARKLNVTFRQKELDFKQREMMLTEELRKKDEVIRQKTYAVEHAKEQLSQMAISAERSKSQQQGQSEEAQIKQKLSFTQKLLQGVKDENTALTKKVAELKSQLITAQSASASKTRTADVDLSALKSKYDRAMKQNDEFKRANQVLLEKLNEIQKPKTGAMGTEELKKKLEAAMRVAGTHQKEADQLKLKVEELQREEARLKGELNRLNNVRSRGSAAKARRDDDPNGSEAA